MYEQIQSQYIDVGSVVFNSDTQSYWMRVRDKSPDPALNTFVCISGEDTGVVTQISKMVSSHFYFVGTVKDVDEDKEPDTLVYYKAVLSSRCGLIIMVPFSTHEVKLININTSTKIETMLPLQMDNNGYVSLRIIEQRLGMEVEIVGDNSDLVVQKF